MFLSRVPRHARFTELLFSSWDKASALYFYGPVLY
jgi:hypothetical protein